MASEKLFRFYAAQSLPLQGRFGGAFYTNSSFPIHKASKKSSIITTAITAIPVHMMDPTLTGILSLS
jgi:hypothetical protein